MLLEGAIKNDVTQVEGISQYFCDTRYKNVSKIDILSKVVRYVALCNDMYLP